MNAVILDFDGTIADSFDHVLQFLLSQSGRRLDQLSPAEHDQLKGLSMKDLAIHVGVPRWRLPLVYFVGKSKLTKKMRHIPLFTGMDQVLASLHGDDYQLFIISSNSRRNISRFMTEHGLTAYFKRIYGNAGWFGKKSVLLRAVEQNGLQAKNTVYVGDEVRDITSAHAAGMAAIAVSWGFSSEEQLLRHNPTVLVRTPAELQRALLDWGRS